MQSELRVEVRRERGATVLTLAGELDLASGPVLEEELERAIGGDAEQLIIDLRALDFIDSTGLSLFVQANQRMQSGGRRLGLVRGGSQVQRLLEVTGIADVLAVADTPEELLSHDRTEQSGYGPTPGDSSSDD
jgi:anti-anti-sigma factor